MSFIHELTTTITTQDIVLPYFFILLNHQPQKILHKLLLGATFILFGFLNSTFKKIKIVSCSRHHSA